MRREDEGDDPIRTGGKRRLDSVGNAWRPVLHAGEDGQPVGRELELERGARLLRDRV